MRRQRDAETQLRPFRIGQAHGDEGFRPGLLRRRHEQYAGRGPTCEIRPLFQRRGVVQRLAQGRAFLPAHGRQGEGFAVGQGRCHAPEQRDANRFKAAQLVPQSQKVVLRGPAPHTAQAVDEGSR